MNLTDLLSGSVISTIAGQTGTSEKDTRNVLANALPALVGAMAQNVSTEEGAESLARALDDHTTAEGLSGLLGKVDTEDGAKILTKILGGQNDAVQKAVAKKSGASKTDTTKILTMAAPLLLAALGSQKKKTKTKSAGLGSLLTGLLGGGEDEEDCKQARAYKVQNMMRRIVHRLKRIGVIRRNPAHPRGLCPADDKEHEPAAAKPLKLLPAAGLRPGLRLCLCRGHLAAPYPRQRTQLGRPLALLSAAGAGHGRGHDGP